MKLANDGRQHVAGLGMRGRDRQGAVFLRHQFTAEAADVVDVAGDLAGVFDNAAAGRRQCLQGLALAGKQLHADFLLELAQLLADARLAGKQAFGGGRDVEPVVNDAQQVLELLQGHLILLGEA